MAEINSSTQQSTFSLIGGPTVEQLALSAELALTLPAALPAALATIGIYPNTLPVSLVMMGDSITAGGNQNFTGSVTLSATGTTVTVTQATHGFQAGNPVFITGCTPDYFNGTFTVATRADANTFTYTLASAITGTVVATSTADVNGSVAAMQVLDPSRVNARSFGEIANAALGHPIDSIINAGGSGQSSFHMLARFQRDVLDQSPSAVLINAGVNDLQAAGYSLANTSANITSMVTQARLAGIRVLLATATPMGTTLTAGANQAKLLLLNKWIREYAGSTIGVFLVPFYSAVVDYTGTSQPAYLANCAIDQLHPNARGGRKMATLALQPALATIFPQNIKRLEVASAVDSYAINAASKQVGANPMGTGTSGTVLGTGHTGTVPTSWLATNGSGPTVVSLAGVTRADGVGLDYQFDFSGTAAGTFDVFVFDLDTASVAAGDIVRASLHLTATGQANINYIRNYMEIVSGGVTYAVDAVSSVSGGNTVTLTDDIDWVLKTNSVVIPAGGVSTMRWRVQVSVAANPTGTFRLGRPALLKS